MSVVIYIYLINMTEQYVKENINKSKYYDFIWVSSASIVYSATLINFAAMLRLSKAKLKLKK